MRGMRSALLHGRMVAINRSIAATSKNRLFSLSTSNGSGSTKRVTNFIDGKFEESLTTTWIPLLNPATQDVLCMVPQSTPDELRRAEVGAMEAFKKWREVPVQQRQVSHRICLTLCSPEDFSCINFTRECFSSSSN